VKKTIFPILKGRENVLLAAWKRIESESVGSALLLHLNYQDTRGIMHQNANEIDSNDNSGDREQKAASISSESGHFLPLFAGVVTFERSPACFILMVNMDRRKDPVL
jgi:hypothetical protein